MDGGGGRSREGGQSGAEGEGTKDKSGLIDKNTRTDRKQVDTETLALGSPSSQSLSITEFVFDSTSLQCTYFSIRH